MMRQRCTALRQKIKNWLSGVAQHMLISKLGVSNLDTIDDESSGARLPLSVCLACGKSVPL